MSQTSAILKLLKTGATLTPLEAYDIFRCWRLAARIQELRDAGHIIITEKIKHDDATFARYRLVN